MVVGRHVDPLEGQPGLLTAEPALQPQNTANFELSLASVCILVQSQSFHLTSSLPRRAVIIWLPSIAWCLFWKYFAWFRQRAHASASDPSNTGPHFSYFNSCPSHNLAERFSSPTQSSFALVTLENSVFRKKVLWKEVPGKISKDVVLKPVNAFQIFFSGNEILVDFRGRALLAWTRKTKKGRKKWKCIWSVQGIF